MAGCGKKEEIQEDEIPNEDIQNIEESNEKTETKTYNDKAVSGLEGATLDYYWNIDTTAFNPTKFNGNINFFGETINGKITTNKLKNAGIEVKGDYLFESNVTGIYYRDNIKLSIDANSVISNDIAGGMTSNDMSLYNYKGDNAIYSDDTLVTMGIGTPWNLTCRNIFPEQFGITTYEDITIDLVLKELGNPTYVIGRKDKNLESIYGYTTYLYVYDDVAFLYSFYNNKNLKLAANFYYPIEKLNGANTGLTNYLELYKTEYEEYLKTK